MENVRFEKFTLLIDGIHKSINKMKFDTVPSLGIKSVHVFWIYELLVHEEGLTCSELAAVSMVDRSLVSREIEVLKKDGYILSEVCTGKRNYNARLTLTEKGKDLAGKIVDVVTEVQNQADMGISEEELLSFYRTLEKLNSNFTNITLKYNEISEKQ